MEWNPAINQWDVKIEHESQHIPASGHAAQPQGRCCPDEQCLKLLWGYGPRAVIILCPKLLELLHAKGLDMDMSIWGNDDIGAC